MWFKRKPQNRRHGREYVLDVKLRSSQVKAKRMRMAVLMLLGCFAALFGIFVCWRSGEWALNRFVYTNPAFAIQEIDVQTDGVIAADQLRRWMGVKPGQNLLALELAKVKSNLEFVPVIRSASVERILPHTLRVRVIERDPIAQVIVARKQDANGISTATFQLDVDGYAMLPLEPRQRAVPLSQPAEPLPIISGLNGNDVQPGRRVDSPQVQAALELITDFDQSPMAGLVELKRVDVSAPDALLVSTGQGSEVSFGLKDLEQQLRRWREVYEWGQRQNKAIASLDLAVSNNIPARWLEASAVPVTPPKAPKILRTKKHHV